MVLGTKNKNKENQGMNEGVDRNKKPAAVNKEKVPEESLGEWVAGKDPDCSNVRPKRQILYISALKNLSTVWTSYSRVDVLLSLKHLNLFRLSAFVATYVQFCAVHIFLVSFNRVMWHVWFMVHVLPVWYYVTT
jgi:hypothetical protein